MSGARNPTVSESARSNYHHDIYEAIRVDVMALGGYKRVGSDLWPTMPPDVAGRRLSDCLNRSRNEKLDPEQVQWIIKAANLRTDSHATMRLMCSECGFVEPRMQIADESRTEIQRKCVEGMAELTEMLKRVRGE